MSVSLSYTAFTPNQAVSADLLITTCGYEARSCHVAQSESVAAAQVVAYTYPENHLHCYGDNLRYFETIAKVRHPDSNEDFQRTIREDFTEHIGSLDSIKVAVDISSFSRERLSIIVRILSEFGEQITVDATFLYSLATFDSHPSLTEANVMINAPLPGYEGWAADPAKPTACLLGLGFENQIALAALETLEPLHTFAFVASNRDSRFDDRVREDNRTLIKSDEVTELNYELHAPFETLHMMESLIHALKDSYRLALIPLGPKPFALLSLLIGQSYQDQITVWRVSSDDDDPQDREASGDIVGLHVTFSS